MNRRARLKWLATRAGMREAARIQRRRRGITYHRYVVGQFLLVGNQVVLHCVEMGRAWEIPRPLRLTADVSRFYRWRTRQAAQQFADRWGLMDAHILNVDRLDVLRAGVQLAPSARALQSVNGSAAAAALAG